MIPKVTPTCTNKVTKDEIKSVPAIYIGRYKFIIHWIRFLREDVQEFQHDSFASPVLD